MQVILLVLTWSLIFSGSAAHGFESPKEDNPRAKKMKKETVRVFTGAIKEIVPITRYQGKAFAIGNDPRWVLTVEIKSMEKETQQRKEGVNQIAYAIHSPVKLLGIPAEKAKGKVFKFEESKLFAEDGKDVGRELVASIKD